MHPARQHLLGRLLPHLPVPVDVVTNDVSPWAGMRDALTREFAGTHLLVVQDDAIVCDEFPAALANVIAAAPDRLLCLFHSGQPRETAKLIRAAPARSLVEIQYARRTSWTPTVATVWPRPVLEAFARWRWTGTPRQRGDDLPVGQFCAAHTGAVACVPSIVQHPDDQPSTWRTRRAMHGRDPKGVAARYEQQSPWALTPPRAVLESGAST